MFRRLQRQINPGHKADFTAPHTRTQHHHLGGDLAVGGAHAAGAITVVENIRDERVLDDPHPALARPFRERLSHVRRIHASVIGEMKTGHEVVDVGEREQFLDLGRGDFAVFDPERARHRAAATHFLGLVVRHRELDRSATNESRRLTGFLLEFAVQFQRILREAGLRLRVAQRRDQTGRVPRRTAAHLLAFEYDDVFPAEFAQMVGRRTADDPAADNDGTGAIRQALVAHIGSCCITVIDTANAAASGSFPVPWLRPQCALRAGVGTSIA